MLCTFGGTTQPSKYGFIDSQTIYEGTISNDYVTVKMWPYGDTLLTVTANKEFYCLRQDILNQGFLHYNTGDILYNSSLPSASGVYYFIYDVAN